MKLMEMRVVVGMKTVKTLLTIGLPKVTSATIASFPPPALDLHIRIPRMKYLSRYLDLDLALALVDLSGVSGGHLVQLRLKSTAAKSRQG